MAKILQMIYINWFYFLQKLYFFNNKCYNNINSTARRGVKIMHDKKNGDYLLFDLDWGKNEMYLRATGGALYDEAGDVVQRHMEHSTAPITPLAHAFRKLAQGKEAKQPVHYVVDAVFDTHSLLLCLHRTDDFQSVVNVPRERLRALLAYLLTPRETQVATLLFEGRTIRYIAGTLHIAEGTVKRIIHNIYQKMNVCSQVELIREIYTRLAQMDWPANPAG
jgi:DNA-binding CsgD family transcriptional regulator